MPRMIEGLTVEELRVVFYAFLEKAANHGDDFKQRVWDAFLVEVEAKCTIVDPDEQDPA